MRAVLHLLAEGICGLLDLLIRRTIIQGSVRLVALTLEMHFS